LLVIEVNFDVTKVLLAVLRWYAGSTNGYNKE
jgi:hypothetical protein